MTRALWSLANFLIALAASTASPLTNAIAVGPTNNSSSPSTPASDAARLISVFLATEYVADPDSDRRSSARLATDSPRYSVITVAVEALNCSAMSATAVALSARAMHTSFGVLKRPSPEMTNAPTQEAVGARTLRRRAPTTVCLVLLRGPPGIPGPSTDCSVTDGLRWIGLHNSVACRYQPKRSDRVIPSATSVSDGGDARVARPFIVGRSHAATTSTRNRS